MRSKQITESPHRIIGSRELKQLIPFSDSYFWKLEQKGSFPKRIKVGESRVGWLYSDVIAWIETRHTPKSSK